MNYGWISKLCIKTKSKIFFTEKLSFTALHFSEDGISAHKIMYICVYYIYRRSKLHISVVIAVD